MSNRAAVVLITMVTVVFLATDAFAQAPAPVLLGAGPSFMEAGGSAGGFVINASKALLSGRNAGVGPVADFSLHSEDGVSWTSFGGGARITSRPLFWKTILFGEFLVGASVLTVPESSSTHLTTNVGGGLHLPLHKRINLLFQFNLLKANGEDDTGKRTTIGISVALGSK